MKRSSTTSFKEVMARLELDDSPKLDDDKPKSPKTSQQLDDKRPSFKEVMAKLDEELDDDKPSFKEVVAKDVKKLKVGQDSQKTN